MPAPRVCVICGGTYSVLAPHQRKQHDIYVRGPKAEEGRRRLAEARAARDQEQAEQAEQFFGCPEPGCDYVGHNDQSLMMHKLRVHRGLDPNKGRRALAVVEVPSPQPTSALNGALRFEQQPTMIVLTDQDGGVWIAERMR